MTSVSYPSGRSLAVGSRAPIPWFLVGSVWLLALMTFSMPNRLPGAVLDTIAFLKIGTRICCLLGLTICLLWHQYHPKRQAVYDGLFPFMLLVLLRRSQHTLVATAQRVVVPNHFIRRGCRTGSERGTALEGSARYITGVFPSRVRALACQRSHSVCVFPVP